MSGVEDGLHLNYTSENGDGRLENGRWTLSIGRGEDSDVCLSKDSFISRRHALLFWDGDHWSLQDCKSTNGTYIEQDDNDIRVTDTVTVPPQQLFRIGHTWMRIEKSE